MRETYNGMIELRSNKSVLYIFFIVVHVNKDLLDPGPNFHYTVIQMGYFTTTESVMSSEKYIYK